jgi:energy-converting hydrogenase B subunit Q
LSDQAAKAGADKVGLVLSTAAAPGVLHQLTGVIARHQGDIRSVSIIEDLPTDTRIYFELDLPGAVESLVEDLRTLEVVLNVTLVQSLQKIYGKRIIIMGGGAQVGQVALGAISEADHSAGWGTGARGGGARLPETAARAGAGAGWIFDGR